MDKYKIILHVAINIRILSILIIFQWYCNAHQELKPEIITLSIMTHVIIVLLLLLLLLTVINNDFLTQEYYICNCFEQLISPQNYFCVKCRHHQYPQQTALHSDHQVYQNLHRQDTLTKRLHSYVLFVFHALPRFWRW